MTQNEFNIICKYYYSLCDEIDNATLYVEPKSQEKVYSIEFAKILFLSCIELESVFKELCLSISGKSRRSITGYASDILATFPNIITAEVEIARTSSVIKPFSKWTSLSSPTWWKRYNDVKHNLSVNLSFASYENAVEALCGLHVSLLYLAKIQKLDIQPRADNYITDSYSPELVYCSPSNNLP